MQKLTGSYVWHYVSDGNKIKGVKAGQCTIYVLANNGIRTTVKVVVK